MDGVHDLGGKEGFGPVIREAGEPVFHSRWEARVFGMCSLYLGFTTNSDHFRHAVERIDPVAYLTHGYYGRWIGGLETRLVEARVLDTDLIDRRALELGARADDRVAARPSRYPDLITERATQEGNRRVASSPPRFSLGARVRTRANGVPGHTRLPAYARGRIGSIVALHEAWVFPDTNAHGNGERPQQLYTVAFEGTELWGPDAERGVIVHLDLFEPYLEHCDG